MRARLLTQGWLVVVTVVTVALASCVPAADESAVPVQEAAPSAMAYTPPTVPPESHDLNQADIERLMEELSNWGRPTSSRQPSGWRRSRWPPRASPFRSLTGS